MLILQNCDSLTVACSDLQFCKVNVLRNIVAQIVTLCKDSLHAGWTLITAGIDANIEYTIVALSHRTGQLLNDRKDHRMTSY
jgi:hypothetical protein